MTPSADQELHINIHQTANLAPAVWLFVVVVISCTDDPQSHQDLQADDVDPSDSVGDPTIPDNGTEADSDSSDVDELVVDLADPDQIDEAVEPHISSDSDNDSLELFTLPECLSGSSPSGCAEPPRLNDWICPENWEPVVMGEGEAWEVTICNPPERVACDDHQAQFTSDTECVDLGTDCPDTRFLSEGQIRALATGFDGDIVYVDGEASEPGDGSRSSPFQTIDSVITATLVSGLTVAFAPGVYEVVLSLDQSIALVGSCVEQTILRSTIHDPIAPVVRFSGDGSFLLRNLTITGERAAIQVENNSESTLLADLVVESAVERGIKITGSSHVELNQLVTLALKA